MAHGTEAMPETKPIVRVIIATCIYIIKTSPIRKTTNHGTTMNAVSTPVMAYSIWGSEHQSVEILFNFPFIPQQPVTT
jgi:hypothetical protein